jgi:hypothetical protein
MTDIVKPDKAAAIVELDDPKRKWPNFYPSNRARLEDSLTPYRSYLNRLIASTCPAALVQTVEQGECSWASHARMLLDHAAKAVEVGRTELAWKCFHEAQRMEIYGLQQLAARGDAEPLRSRANYIANEAHQKLRGWRKETVKRLLGSPESPRDDFTVAQITESHLILTESFANTYHKLRAQRWQVGLLSAVAIVALVTWLALGGFQLLAANAAATLPRVLLGSIVLFGVLGAAISGILSLVRSESGTIPQQLVAWTGTLARLVVGAVAALIVFLTIDKIVGQPVAPRLILLQSFAAGFSERLLTAAVDKVGA